jgi:hypothetical protein
MFAPVSVDRQQFGFKFEGRPAGEPGKASFQQVDNAAINRDRERRSQREVGG